MNQIHFGLCSMKKSMQNYKRLAISIHKMVPAKFASQHCIVITVVKIWNFDFGCDKLKRENSSRHFHSPEIFGEPLHSPLSTKIWRVSGEFSKSSPDKFGNFPRRASPETIH